MSQAEREVVDEALEVAGRVLPGSTRAQRLEAMAQELLGDHPALADGTDQQRLGGSFQVGRTPSEAEARRAVTLEAETDRWAALPRILDVPAPEAGFDELTSTAEIDARLRLLARFRAGWDAAIGLFAYVLQDSRIPEVLGFASFRHYVEERLGLPARTVEQRVALERRLHASAPLREAKRQRLSYEKLRALARLPDREFAAWTPRAHALTCIELQRRIDEELERQTCGGDEQENLVALCAFHHLRCIHGGWLRVSGRAPDGLRWELGGAVWTGVECTADASRPAAAVAS